MRPHLETLENRLCPTQITYHGGPVLDAPAVAMLHVGDTQPALTDGAMGVLLTKYLPLLSADYNVGAGTLAFSGQFVPLPGNPTNAQITAWLTQEIDAGTVPPPGTQTLYMLYLAPGQLVSDSWAGNAIAGYHSSFQLNGQAVYYAVCYQLPPTDETQVECHELAEAATNPGGTGWFDGATGQEIEDVYMWLHPFTLDGYWMSAASGPQGQVILPAPPVPVPPPAMTVADFWALAVTEAEAVLFGDVAAFLPAFRGLADARAQQVADSVFAGTWPWAAAVAEGERLVAAVVG